MNRKIEIDKSDGIWMAILIEYDVLPFNTRADKKIKKITAASFGGLMKEIGSNNWVDEINKND